MRTNCVRKETGTPINGLDQKEEINFQPEENEKTKIQKDEEKLRKLQDNFRCSNMRIIEVPKGEKEEQEIKTLFEKIVKENFPNLIKKIDVRVQEPQRIPNKMDPKRTMPRHIIIQMPKVKYKEKILKSIKRKAVGYLQGSSLKTVS